MDQATVTRMRRLLAEAAAAPTHDAQRRMRDTKAATVLPNDRKKIRADIRAAIERVKARKKNQM